MAIFFAPFQKIRLKHQEVSYSDSKSNVPFDLRAAYGRQSQPAPTKPTVLASAYTDAIPMPDKIMANLNWNWNYSATAASVNDDHAICPYYRAAHVCLDYCEAIFGNAALDDNYSSRVLKILLPKFLFRVYSNIAA